MCGEALRAHQPWRHFYTNVFPKSRLLLSCRLITINILNQPCCQSYTALVASLQ